MFYTYSSVRQNAIYKVKKVFVPKVHKYILYWANVWPDSSSTSNLINHPLSHIDDRFSLDIIFFFFLSDSIKDKENTISNKTKSCYLGRKFLGNKSLLRFPFGKNRLNA